MICHAREFNRWHVSPSTRLKYGILTDNWWFLSVCCALVLEKAPTTVTVERRCETQESKAKTVAKARAPLATTKTPPPPVFLFPHNSRRLLFYFNPFHHPCMACLSHHHNRNHIWLTLPNNNNNNNMLSERFPLSQAYRLEKVFPVYAMGIPDPDPDSILDGSDPIWEAVKQEAKLEVRNFSLFLLMGLRWVVVIITRLF